MAKEISRLGLEDFGCKKQKQKKTETLNNGGSFPPFVRRFNVSTFGPVVDFLSDLLPRILSANCLTFFLGKNIKNSGKHSDDILSDAC